MVFFINNSNIRPLKFPKPKAVKVKKINEDKSHCNFKKRSSRSTGKAIQQTLNGMGHNNVEDVRQGKFFDININEKDEKKAKIKS